jgi:predicted nucleotidyltransferase
MDEVLEAFWGSRTFPKVLRQLTTATVREFTLSELAAGTGCSRDSLHRALQRALTVGIVARRLVGRHYVYRINTESPFYPEVRSLTSKMLGAGRIIQDALRSLNSRKVEAAFIFGSLASGTERPDSDVDLFVVGQATRFDLADVLREPTAELGRTINPVVYPRAEIERRLAGGDSFLREVLSGAKQMVVGQVADLPHEREG